MFSQGEHQVGVNEGSCQELPIQVSSSHAALPAPTHLQQEDSARKTADRSFRPFCLHNVVDERSHRAALAAKRLSALQREHSAELDGSVLQCEMTKLFHLEHLAGPQHGRTPKNMYLHDLLASPHLICTLLCTRQLQGRKFQPKVMYFL